MRAAFAVMQKDLTRFVSDRRALVMSIVVPFFLILIVGAVFGSFGSDSGTSVVDTPIYVGDQGAAAQQIMQALKQVPNLNLEMKTSAADARSPVENGDRSAAIIIPAGISSAVEHGQAATVTVFKTPSSQDYRALVVQSIVDNVTQKFTAANVAANVAVNAVQSSGASANPTAVADQARQQATQQLSQQPIVSVSTETANQTVNDSGYNQVVPGYALMFAMFAVAGGVGSILEEKEAGVWKRLLISPISRWSLLGGKLLAQFVIAVGQISLLFAIGRLLFGINLGSVLGVFLVIVTTALATTAFSMLLVSFVKTRAQLQPVTTISVLTFSALGGAWWPLFLMPGWLQKVGKVTLSAWAMTGFNNLMIFNKGFTSAVPSILVLLAYSAVCFLLAARFFRFQEAA
ncbi:MAG: ABC transporter permease [Nitrolancea sp.]